MKYVKLQVENGKHLATSVKEIKTNKTKQKIQSNEYIKIAELLNHNSLQSRFRMLIL